MKVTPLDRKLLRDLWQMRGQAVAIALVIGSGLAMFVMYFSNFDSLRRTQRLYYERQRFAEVFASLKRAPQRLAERLATVPGVAVVDTRVVADVTLDVLGLPEPATGRLVSIPAAGRPRLNDVFLRRGRWIEPGRPDEVLASEAFAAANGLVAGSRVAAVINGRRRSLTVVGLALSPEYVYSIRPGEIIPDDRRFGVLWMERRALASAFDMEGGFNDVSLALRPGASLPEVIARVDRLLAPWGGLGAIPRRLQPSHWTLDNELQQLRTFGVMVPAIFLGVAAFLLNMALTRVLALQRAQIAALKALGYRNAELAWHYLKWALVIAALGAFVGTAAGGWLGSAMIRLYNQFFRFPMLDYRLSAGVALGAVAVALVAAALGAALAVRRAVRIPPAEAMRPEPPARYRASLAERLVGARLTHASRMVLRNIERQPLRAGASVVGIAFATAILAVGFFFIDAIDAVVSMQFERVQRQDVGVVFFEPASPGAFHEVRALPGVLHAEPFRSVPARVRFGHRERRLAVTGLPADATLQRVVDTSGRVVTLPGDGLVLSRTLAGVLGAGRGDTVTLEVLEGKRPVREAVVAGLVDEYMGLAAYMEIGALRRLLREGATLSGANLQVDEAALDDLYRRLKATPRVAAVNLTRAALTSFRDVMTQNTRITTVLNLVFAGIIAFGVVYNAARISLSERSRELASLRVLGFTRAEISLVLLGELAVLTLAALPLGLLLGWGLGLLILSSLESEVYRFPLTVTPPGMAWSCLAVITAAALSGLVVRRRLDRLDLVAVLKSPE
ncbi:MAG TPA: FtsX-like permease family protein [Vicinamibacteria bacterium]|nr:FtsX-like permease family protein [Vicinamibacteria bacterium]